MRGTVATMPLIPAVVDAVSPVPVVAVGGIADGRGLAAALTLGAAGAWIGTRFLASGEAAIHPRYRERLLRASETDTIYLENLFDVRWPNAPQRVLRNKTVEAWEAARRPPTGMRPGQGEVIGTSRSVGPIVRYQSYTPGAERCRRHVAMGRAERRPRLEASACRRHRARDRRRSTLDPAALGALITCRPPPPPPAPRRRRANPP